MSFLKRVIMAVFASKQQNSQTMDIEMDDCASYESFCYSMKTTKKPYFSPDVSDNSSDSDEFDLEADNDSDEDIDWTNDEQSCEVEESMDDDDFEIVFEEPSDMTPFQQKRNLVWEEASENIENQRSTPKIWIDDNEQSPQSTTKELEVFIQQQLKKREILQKVNKEWDEAYNAIDENAKSITKVSFAPDDSLTDIFPADICDRKGEWMMYAIDRMHFQRRIAETETILTPCFSKENRTKVLFRLQMDVEQKFCSDMK